jgi:hypothetical protein
MTRQPHPDKPNLGSGLRLFGGTSGKLRRATTYSSTVMASEPLLDMPNRNRTSIISNPTHNIAIKKQTRNMMGAEGDVHVYSASKKS